MKYVNRIYILGFLIFGLSGCSTIASSVISGQAPTLSLATAEKAEDKLFQQQDTLDYPLDLMNDKKAQEYTDNLYNKLITSNDNKNLGFVILYKTARVQGSSWLGGSIEITRGMLNSIHNEAEFACLLSHEIGHQALGHLEQMNQDSPLGTALSKGLGYVNSDQELLSKLNQERTEIRRSGWSKAREIAADKFGAELAAKAGYDPYAFCDLLERLSKKIEDNAIYRLKKFKGTHPALADRAVILRKYLDSKGYKPGKGVKNSEKYTEGMSDLVNIRTGESPKKQSFLYKNKSEECLCSLNFSRDKDLFMEEIIYQDEPTWGVSGDMKALTAIARGLIGTPYTKLDCSGFTHTIYPQIPTGAQYQYNYFNNMNSIMPARNDLQEGDLIFFDDGAGNIQHVGYVESNNNGYITFLDSTEHGNGVHESHLSTTGTQGSQNMYGTDEYFAGGGRIK